MTDTPRPEEILDIAGPEGESLFWHTKKWLLEEHIPELQKSLDATWAHYKSIEDERLLALVGALCIEAAVDALLVSFAPGFGACISDTDFTFSVKLKLLRSLRLLPSRIVTSCDLVRQVRNEFAHRLERRAFADLEDKHRSKLLPHVESFNREPRDETNYNKQFRDLVGFLIAALWVYTRQVSQLRKFLDTQSFREPFRAWIDSERETSRAAG